MRSEGRFTRCAMRQPVGRPIMPPGIAATYRLSNDPPNIQGHNARPGHMPISQPADILSRRGALDPKTSASPRREHGRAACLPELGRGRSPEELGHPSPDFLRSCYAGSVVPPTARAVLGNTALSSLVYQAAALVGNLQEDSRQTRSGPLADRGGYSNEAARKTSE